MAEMNTEWRNWVEENVLRGIPGQELVQILLQHEFDALEACQTVVELSNQHQGNGGAALSLDDMMVMISPSAGFERTMPCTGKEQPWSVTMSMSKPIIVAYQNVLSYEECDRLVEMAKPKLQRSTTVHSETGEFKPHEHRTSQGTFFQLRENAFIKEIDERVSRMMNLPVENGEGLQILNYQIGGEYRPHFDYFPPHLPGSASHIQHGGQRVATLILYLNDVEEGGETIFPELNLKIAPVKGGAVYFSYYHRGQVDPLTLHGGAPVVQGEKWIATKWMREGRRE